jgi:hydroxymethylpyrimidine kinase / phosphomethylpyrimidine kinase / thiamine-phosphate diphosphorylase
LKVALSIAGSDSSAGAGIQADLKTFTTLGVYGCTAITAVTAQNTREVTGIFEIEPESIAKQIRSVIQDMPPHAIKIGMIYNRENIRTISREVKMTDAPIVLDPILSASSGGQLLLPDSFESFMTELIPLSTIITPNRLEAQKIAGFKIVSRSDVFRATRKIKDLGAKNVIIKGNPTKKKKVADNLMNSEGRFIEISNTRLALERTHGTGCNFSAAITAYLAKGFSIIEACELANKYVWDSFQDSLKIGKGLLISNPAGSMYENACKYIVMKQLRIAIEEIEAFENFGKLIPETQSNIAFALPDARDLDHVAAIKGRFVKIGDSVTTASSIIEFGASKHVGSAILAYMTVNRLIRSAVNIKYDEKIRKIIMSIFKVSKYDRMKEPKHIVKKEGMSIFWGIKWALAKYPEAEIIYHKGALGKEPMCIIFGNDPIEVVNKIRILLNHL